MTNPCFYNKPPEPLSYQLYLIAAGRSVVHLEKQVNLYLQEGYACQGGVWSDNEKRHQMYFQALIKG